VKDKITNTNLQIEGMGRVPVRIVIPNYNPNAHIDDAQYDERYIELPNGHRIDAYGKNGYPVSERYQKELARRYIMDNPDSATSTTTSRL